VSFLKKAQEAAEAARLRMEEAARAANDPETQERINKGLSGAQAGAREAVGMAKRGVNTVVEKIDPGTLADLIIKATALQEMTNRALREKHSPYRIAEISISASIPPGVSFSISRLDDEPEALDAEVTSSAELIEAAPDSSELVIALDGTTLDQTTADAIAEAATAPGDAMPPSTVQRS
jgi:hypothetical protein